MSNFDIDEAARAFNWETLMLGVSEDVQESNDNWICFCPFCHHTRICFAVSRQGLFICYHCHAKGNGVGLLMRLLNLTRSQAIERLTGGAATYDPVEIAPKPVRSIILPDEFELLTLPVTTGNARFWRYLAQRRLGYSTVLRYRAGFARTGPYAGRVIIPVSYHGELVSWIARDITNTAQSKVLTPAGGRQSQHLFNLDAVEAWDTCVIVEGVFDCMALGDGVVASFGKRLSDEQIALLLKSGFKEVTVCWDADAYREAQDTALRLSSVMEVQVALLARGDPNDQSLDVVLRTIAEARAPSPFTRMATGYKTTGGNR